MNSRLARWLVRLYPHAWRTRYGEEFEALLQEGHGGVRALANIFYCALREHLATASTVGMVTNPYPNSILSLSRKPSAFVPMAMSLAALGLLVGSIAVFGMVRETDEGAIAHLWQLLMAGQLPILAYFVYRWLPRTPRYTFYVLAIQIAAALAAIAPVYFLKL